MLQRHELQASAASGGAALQQQHDRSPSSSAERIAAVRLQLQLPPLMAPGSGTSPLLILALTPSLYRIRCAPRALLLLLVMAKRIIDGSAPFLFAA